MRTIEKPRDFRECLLLATLLLGTLPQASEARRKKAIEIAEKEDIVVPDIWRTAN